jgi:hypothetical protein
MMQLEKLNPMAVAEILGKEVEYFFVFTQLIWAE